MTSPTPGPRYDWQDAAGALSLVLIGAGATITWHIGIALLIIGGLTASLIAVLTFRR